MTLSDLIFLAAVLASVVTLIGVTIAALLGRLAQAARALLVYAVCAAVYFTISVGAAYVRPQRIRAALEPWCFDDWCLQVQGVESVARPPSVSYSVKLRIYSTARRVSQRANGAWIYLIDERQRLFAPNPDASATPLTMKLGPLESVETSRVFDVPADAQKLGLITGHPGPYCALFGLAFIGQATCLFGRPEMIPIK
jgi:hypothetical protein